VGLSPWPGRVRRRTALALPALGLLGPALTAPGAGQGEAAKTRIAGLDRLRDEVQLVATAVTTPLRPHPAMRPR
jgi:hypothetical protein